jgi:16S rRNA processing protein RimM
MKGEVTIIGKIIKPEGVKGFLKLDIEDGFEKSILKAPFIFIVIDGLPVPFKVEECTEGRHLLVKLEDVDLPEEAARYAHLPLALHEKHIRYIRKVPSASLEQLAGYTMYHENKVVGVIKEVARFPGQMMAIIEDDSGKTIHIPLVSEWIQQKDDESKKIFMSLPEGLLEV